MKLEPKDKLTDLLVALFRLISTVNAATHTGSLLHIRLMLFSITYFPTHGSTRIDEKPRKLVARIDRSAKEGGIPKEQREYTNISS